MSLDFSKIFSTTEIDFDANGQNANIVTNVAPHPTTVRLAPTAGSCPWDGGNWAAPARLRVRSSGILI